MTEIGENAVINYFHTHSETVPAITEFPGTYSMLEFMYGLKVAKSPIDHYFTNNLHGGVSLERRYHAVNENATLHIRQLLEQQEKCLVLDLGSGPGRNRIAMTLENPEFAERVTFHCIETDPAAIEFGTKLVEEHRLTNIHFINKSMTKLHRQYRQTADYGLLIGVLCGLNIEERTSLLKIIRPYFIPGARVVGAGLLDRSLELDLFSAYVIYETSGWVLQHHPIGSIKKAYESAGYHYEGFFQDEPTRCYEIGVGLA